MEIASGDRSSFAAVSQSKKTSQVVLSQSLAVYNKLSIKIQIRIKPLPTSYRCQKQLCFNHSDTSELWMITFLNPRISFAWFCKTQRSLYQ